MTTANPQYAMFTRAEMERRYTRARELMAQQGIDALFVSGEENFQYLAGTTGSIGLHYSLARPSVFILPMERDPVIITQSRDNFTEGSYVADIRGYFDVLRFSRQLAVDTLRELELEEGRIGTELGQEQRMGMPVGDHLAVAAALPKAKFVDGAEVIVKLRMVKSEEELVYIRKAADITRRARQRLFDECIVPGVTEREVARAIRRLILEEGGDRTSFVHIQLDKQQDFPGAKNQFHYDRPLQKGRVLGVDTGAYCWQYTVDYPRFAALGKASDEQKRVYDAIVEINRKMAEALRPGVTCAEIYQVGAKAIEDAGLTFDDPVKLKGGARMGHGQGMLLTEPPSINPRDHTVLEPGVVLSTEPGAMSKDSGIGFLWEDVHVVTEDGHEQITLDSEELREIAF